MIDLFGIEWGRGVKWDFFSVKIKFDGPRMLEKWNFRGTGMISVLHKNEEIPFFQNLAGQNLN